MKKVLIISYYWPPSGGSGVQRWVKFSRYLPANGWKPIVYTPENPELTTIDASLAEEIPPETEILKTRIFEPYNIYRNLSGKGKKGSAQKEEVNPINAQKKSLGQKAAMFIRGNFFVPDPRCFWVSPSVSYLLKYLRSHPVDAIVSTGPPHSMHLIAMKVAQKTGLPWVADFRDPWTKMFYFKHLNLSPWAQKRHRKLESAVLDNATAVVAVSPFVQREFMEMTETPVHLITNGYDEEDFKQQAFHDGHFNITHTGLFASDGNPITLWKVLSDLCHEDKSFRELLRIRLAGKTDRKILESVKNAGLMEQTVDLGYCMHKTAVQEQINATLLILPLRQEPEYKATLPGKLFEYLASRRPILGIGQKDGAMAEILNETEAGKTYDWDEYEHIKDFIQRNWKAFSENKDISTTKDIRKYSRKSTAVQMAELLNKITKNTDK